MKSKVLAETLGLMTTAFGLVAALAWNEAVKKLIDEFIPKRGQGVLSLFLYAIFITIITVIISSRLMKIKEKFAEEEKEKQNGLFCRNQNRNINPV